MSLESTIHDRRRKLTVAGLGATAGGLMLAAFSQLALAPSAQAQPDDPFSDIASFVQSDFYRGESNFGDAQYDFSIGDSQDGFSNSLIGFDNFTFAPANTAFLNGFDALTGSPEVGPTYFLTPVDVPVNFAQGLEYAQGDVADAQGLFGTAATDFGLGDFSAALTADDFGIANLLVVAPDDIITGLVSSLLGGAIVD